MVKRLLFLTITLFFIQITVVFSQINGVTANAGPYTPGSSIAATFSIDNSTCINRDNRFDLVLVSPGGVELGTIGSYTGFYTTFINGTIPAGTPAGMNYRLRITGIMIVTEYTVQSALQFNWTWFSRTKVY